MAQRSCTAACWLFLLLFALPFAGGCSDGLGDVTGTVTLDGQPVPDGSITFVSQDQNDPRREGAVITAGKFAARIPPGQYKLELNAQKVVGTRTQKSFDGTPETVPTTAELFPPKYNTQSQLVHEIKAGANSLPLDLSTKP